MFDDFFEDLLRDSVWYERDASPRVQRIMRGVFGALGAGLAIVGAAVTAQRYAGANQLILAGFIGVFVAVFLFCIWTVILGRSPRLSAWLLGLSFATAFLARVIGGA
jgi:FtsH-binding integral membrane protein